MSFPRSLAAPFKDASFSGHADFVGVTFSGQVGLDGVVVADAGRPHVWPPGWRMEGWR